MTYDAAVKQATESLADMIQEFRDPIRDSGMIAIASFEKLV